MSEDAAIVLAAGKGTRMRSSLPKVLHPVAGKSMITRVLDSLGRVGFNHPTVVVGYGADRIQEHTGDRCLYVDQGEQLGTGHAARIALQTLPSSVERVLLIHGDEPLLPSGTLQEMLELQTVTGAPVVLLTTHVTDTRNFGRVVRNESGAPVGLAQEWDLTPQQRMLNEVNLGAYVFDVAFLRRHAELFQPHPPKGEYYLTDIVHMATEGGIGVAAVTVEGGDEVMGVNDLVHLEAATRTLYRRKNEELMLSGVTIIDSATTFIDEDVRIAQETVIHPFTVISGDTQIGNSCIIGPGAHILSSRIGDKCTVVSSTVGGSAIGDGVRVGPYAHVRGGAHIGSGGEIGTGSEIKRSTLGPGTKMHHFGYLGDARVGADVNIGAGVVTCNFDGTTKHETVIEDRAFVGSDTMLRAPIVIGEDSATGAGSVVTHDVPPGVTVAGIPARILKGTVSSGPTDAESAQDPSTGVRRGS